MTLTSLTPLTQFREVGTLWPLLSTMLGNGYFFVIAVTILTLLVTGVALVLKYGPHLLVDLKNLAGELPVLAVRLWFVLLLVLPVFFDAGPLWYVLWWFALLWGYVNRTERRLAFLIISLVFMSGWMAHLGAGFITYASTQVNREIFAVEYDLASSKESVDLGAWVRSHPADAEGMHALAMDECRRGNDAHAVQLLKRALDLEPNNARYYNTLGIALVHLERGRDAVKAFANSAALEPEKAVYHYNVSRVSQRMFNFYEAETALHRASDLAPTRVHRWLDQEVVHADNGLLFTHVPVRRYLARQMRPTEELSAVADDLWHGAFGIIPRRHAILLTLGCALILALLGYIPEDKFTKVCNRCGTHFYVGTTSTQGNPQCLPCHWMDTKAKKYAEHVQAGKVEEIRAYRREMNVRMARLERIVPGLGAFFGHQTGTALVRFIFFSAGLVLVVTGGQFVYSFLPTGLHLQPVLRILGGSILAILYLRALKSGPVRQGG